MKFNLVSITTWFLTASHAEKCLKVFHWKWKRMHMYQKEQSGSGGQWQYRKEQSCKGCWLQCVRWQGGVVEGSTQRPTESTNEGNGKQPSILLIVPQVTKQSVLDTIFRLGLISGNNIPATVMPDDGHLSTVLDIQHQNSLRCSVLIGISPGMEQHF